MENVHYDAENIIEDAMYELESKLEELKDLKAGRGMGYNLQLEMKALRKAISILRDAI